MDSMFPQKIPKRQDTSEKKKAKQYGAAALLCILAAVIMTVIKWIWGGVTLGGGRDEVPLIRSLAFHALGQERTA